MSFTLACDLPVPKKYCPDCGREIAQAARRCSICAAKYRRKVIRPSIEILRKEKEHMGYVSALVDNNV